MFQMSNVKCQILIFSIIVRDIHLTKRFNDNVPFVTKRKKECPGEERLGSIFLLFFSKAASGHNLVSHEHVNVNPFRTARTFWERFSWIFWFDNVYSGNKRVGVNEVLGCLFRPG